MKKKQYKGFKAVTTALIEGKKLTCSFDDKICIYLDENGDVNSTNKDYCYSFFVGDFNSVWVESIPTISSDELQIGDRFKTNMGNIVTVRAMYKTMIIVEALDGCLYPIDTNLPYNRMFELIQG